ncbi:MAG: hypothetical protein ABH950_02055 [Candidatus Altiarchaeota archaeon]
MDIKNNDKFLEAKLLFKLARRRNWGASHTSFHNLTKGFKPKDQKQIKKIAEQLLKTGFLIKKPTSYGLEISLNSNKSKQIKQKIKEMLGEYTK